MYRKAKGFRDIFGDEITAWHRVEEAFRTLCKRYNYEEFKLPMLERTEVFARGIGDTTDIVEKEMFTFDDHGDMLTLRPEGTAGLVRAFIENKCYNPPGLKKYWYMGPMFRRERPQKGRYRQFVQVGIEAFGVDAPMLDAEVITLLFELAAEVGLEGKTKMEINSIGCPECRPAYQEKLIAYFHDHESNLCEDCLRRLGKNPLRILDCKNDGCKAIAQNAPIMLDHLCGDCVEHFDAVKTHLEGFNVPYSVNPMMVRGLDYYVRTAFELVTEHLGAQNAVGAGGRYDGLVKLLGGPDVPGIGFALGVDRLATLLMEQQGVEADGADIFVLMMPETAKEGQKLVSELRTSNLRVEIDPELKSIKSQMKKADRANANYVLILAEDELKAQMAAIKDMETGEQMQVPLHDAAAYLIEKLSV